MLHILQKKLSNHLTRFRIAPYLILLMLFFCGSLESTFANPVLEDTKTQKNGSNVTSITIEKPTGTVVDELLLAIISIDGNKTVTAPVGWTTLDNGQANGNAATLAVYYKISTASEPANYTFTWAGGEHNLGAIMRYSNVDTNNPIDVINSITATGTSNGPTAPDIATVSDNTTIVYAYAADADYGNEPNYNPAGTTGILGDRSANSGANGASIGIAYKTLTSGSTGTGVFDMRNNNSEEWRAITIIVNEPAVATEILSLSIDQTNCTDNGNGTFTASYDALIDWGNCTYVGGDMINLTNNGSLIGTIDPNIATNPSTVSFSLSADGNGTNLIKAEVTNTSCVDSLSFNTPVPCPSNVAACIGTTGCLGGNVFEDFNFNGMEDINEQGVEGVQVDVYDENGISISTVWSDSDGDWEACSLTDGDQYRVEFSLPANLASWAQPTNSGTDNGTDIQFLTAPACTKFSISNPSDFCQDNPYLVVPCYVKGDNTGTEDVLVRWSYDNSGLLPGDKTKITDANQAASTWGTAYEPKSKMAYAAAVLKTHAGLHEGPGGVGGLDAIFSIDPYSASNGSVWLELEDDLSIDVGQSLIPTNAARGLGNASQHDDVVFPLIGTVGIGDIEISEDGNTMYVMNLYDKTLYTIDMATKTLLNSYPVPDPNCSNGTYRPWAIEVHQGQVYVGSICDASTSGKDATAVDALTNTTGVTDLHAYVYRLDGGVYSNVLDFPLDYNKQPPMQLAWGNMLDADQWYPWTSDLPVVSVTTGGGLGIVTYPSPILTDIVFDDNGSMILGFMDRTAMQLGDENYSGDPSTGTDLYSVFSGGDILHACENGMSWVIEGAANGCTNSGGHALGTGTGVYSNGVGEYYEGEFFDGDNPIAVGFDHAETALGSVIFLRGEDHVVTTVFDPISGDTNYKRGGISKLNNSTGLQDDGFQVYGDGAATFGKGAGLGDLIALCAAAPIEIGNYVWNDANENGLQDAGESGIDGIIVQLYDAAGTLVGQDTSTNGGQYYFNPSNVDTDGITVNGSGIASASTGWSGMDFSAQYFIVFGDAQFYQTELTLGSDTYEITTADAGSNDNIDSDVDPNSLTTGSLGNRPDGLPYIDITTPGVGGASHHFEFGLVLFGDGVIGNTVWIDENADGIQDAGEPGIPGVEVELIDSNGDVVDTVSTGANGGYVFTDLLDDTYTVNIIASSLPTGVVPTFDEDNGTTTPDQTTDVIVANGEEHMSAYFGYNYTTKADTDSPASMTAPGAIGNRIWNDANSDGLQNAGESGIPNITVELWTDPDQDGVYTASGTTTTTDAFGNYVFDNVAPGAYVINIVEAGLTSAGFNTTPTDDPDGDGDNISEPIIIAPGDVWLGGDFGYNNPTNPADIGSTVFVDVDGDGTYNGVNDLPLENVSVVLIDDANNNGVFDANEMVVATTMTDESGNYLFPDLADGNYVVEITDVNNVIGDLQNTVDPDGGNDEYTDATLAGVDLLNQNFGYVPGNHTTGQGFIGNLIFHDADGGGDQDPEEAGIEGIDVELLDDASGNVITKTTTNENGMYFFGGLVDGAYRVRVDATTIPTGMSPSFDPDGGAPANNEGATVNISGGSSDLAQDFGYEATTPYSISGTIWEDTNAEGVLDGAETNRFDGVTVDLIDANGNVVSSTTTDVSGNYSFGNISDGTYTVQVTDVNGVLSDYWHSLGTDSENDPVQIIVAGANMTDVDFGYYEAAASIGNVVFNDDNYNGLQDAGELGVPNVPVTLEIEYNNDLTADVTVTTLTDATGQYSFDNLLIDEDYNGDGSGTEPIYTISMTAPNGYISTLSDVNTNGNDAEDADDPNGVVAMVAQGQTDVNKLVDPTMEPSNATYDFGIIEQATTIVGNRIWIDENADGLQDAGEPGIPNVVVELLDAGSMVVGTTITDADGGYKFTNVLTGNYTVRVSSGVPTGLNAIYDEDDGTTAPNMEAAVTVISNEYVTADFGYNYTTKADTDSPAMAATGALGNRIWNDANNNGIEDPGESGIPNITVELWTDPDLDGVYTPSGTTTTTNDFGIYVFDNIAPGAYVINVVDGGLTSAGFNTTPTDDPDGDGDNISEPVIIAPGDVWLGGDFGYQSTGTPADIGSTIFVDVDADGSFNVVNDLPLEGVTVALVQDTDGNGIWNAGESVVATTVTVADGSYLFPDLASDDYVVVVTDVDNVINDLTNSVDPDGGNDAYSGVALAMTDELTENFGYVPAGHVVGQGFIGNMVFLDADGAGDFDADEPGIEGVKVELVDPMSSAILATTATNENGMYFFGNLDDGDYKVRLDATSVPSGLVTSFDPDGGAPPNNEGATVTIVSGSSDLNQDFGFKATTPYSISGTIWEDTNAEGTLDVAEANRFEGVTIDLVDANGNIISSTITDVNGNYSFTQIPDGTYTVEVTDTEDHLMGLWHSSGTDSESDPVTVIMSGANVTDVDFGYYIDGSSIGNMVWLDYNENNAQDIGEPGLPGVKLTLEIDYDNDASADVSVVTVTAPDGSYSFKGLLLDENYNGTGVTPDYNLVVTLPDANMAAAYTVNVADQAGGNDMLDSDTHAGHVVTLVQGQDDVVNKADASTETAEGAHDFGYTLDCANSVVEYAMTDDGSNPGTANQTTDYFAAAAGVNAIQTHTAQTRLDGSIQSWTYCEVNGWHYYYNPQDPDEYLFAIEHGANTTEIEYIEVRVDDDATDRHFSDANDATFVMVRDWMVKTKNDAPLTADVNIRFYFPPAEYKQMLDAAKAQATAWGVSDPDETMVQWFMKTAFDPDADINPTNTVLSTFDVTSLRNAASDANGNNTALAVPTVENNINHIQFNAVSSISGGTGMIHINKIALPVELSRFVATPQGCNVNIEWSSASEESFSHYELERSLDGSNYEGITKVVSQGGNLEQHYHYFDKQALPRGYYRLKMVDLDGSIEYSPIRQVTTDCSEEFDIIIYPNPAQTRTAISVKFFAESAEAKLQLTDMLGRVLKVIPFSNLEREWNTTIIDLNNLPSGNYYLHIDAAGDRVSKAFIIQE